MATQSGTRSGGVASRAIDGDRNGIWLEGSVSQTKLNEVGWWQVDLGVERPVNRIAPFNRTDSRMVRLSNFRIVLRDDAGVEVVHSDFYTEEGHVSYRSSRKLRFRRRRSR